MRTSSRHGQALGLKVTPPPITLTKHTLSHTHHVNHILHVHAHAHIQQTRPGPRLKGYPASNHTDQTHSHTHTMLTTYCTSTRMRTSSRRGQALGLKASPASGHIDQNTLCHTHTHTHTHIHTVLTTYCTSTRMRTSSRRGQALGSKAPPQPVALLWGVAAEAPSQHTMLHTEAPAITHTPSWASTKQEYCVFACACVRV